MASPRYPLILFRMMKYFCSGGWAAALLLLTASCTKVVDLDLQDAEPRLMIEANLADNGQPCTVQLTRTASYQETNTFPPVIGAVITLTNDAGISETLQETTPGYYQGRTMTGQSGHRYTLRVETEGQSYVAASTMPAVVPLTGLQVEKSEFTDDLQVVPEYQDPAVVRDYYLFR